MSGNEDFVCERKNFIVYALLNLAYSHNGRAPKRPRTNKAARPLQPAAVLVRGLESAADRHDMKEFYAGLKVVYGRREISCAPVKSLDGCLITDRKEVLARWVEHFQSVLNQKSDFDSQVLSKIPQWATATHLDDTPTVQEIQHSLKEMSSGKAPGIDGIPAEVLKYGGPSLVTHLTDLIGKIWEEKAVPQDFKDALLVHVYKHKGDRACCNNHRGISLLCIAGKVLARVLLNRLNDHVHNNSVIPASQCPVRVSCRSRNHGHDLYDQAAAREVS